MKKFIAGLCIGLFLGAAPALAYYSYYTSVTELKVSDLKRIISDAVDDTVECSSTSDIKRTLNSCKILSSTYGGDKLSCY